LNEIWLTAGVLVLTSFGKSHYGLFAGNLY